MDSVGFPLAFLAGIVSFASPCCLPLVSVFVSYMVGTTEPDSPAARWAALRQACAFVLGFSVVFITLWASVGLMGYALRDYTSTLRLVGGIALVVMGLHVAGLIRISALYREVRVPIGPNAGLPSRRDPAHPVVPSYRRSALLGVAFAAGWTPCVGPILGGIIGLASVTSSVTQGAALLAVYALGLGLPFMLVAVGVTEVNQRLTWFRRHQAGVSLVTGATLILVGFLMITNLFARLAGVAPTFAL
jgi:cytochrome c-type biogenesis protein